MSESKTVVFGSASLAVSAGLSIVAASMFAVPTAFAQTAETGATRGGDALEEVVVTAERRSQDLQKAAVSVTALSGEELQQQGRTSIQQILQDVPGLTILAPQTGVSNNVPAALPSDSPAAGVTIRGVPSLPTETVGSSNYAVAYYVDGIFNGLGGGFDLERVEVLRGPQGTLYGRSATSGVISVYTRDPELNGFHADVTAEVGSQQLRHVQAGVNAQLGEAFALRVSANQVDEDGQISAEGTRFRQQEGRVKLLFKPSEKFRLLLGYAGRKDKSNFGGAIQGSLPGQPDSQVVFGGLDIYPNFTNQHQAWAKADWDVGIGTLTYQPAYRSFTTHGTISAVQGLIKQEQAIPKDKFVTHELRLASPADSKINWVVGAIYFDNQQRQIFHPVVISSGAFITDNTTDRDVTDTGGFAEATIPFGTDWRVTGGLRYDKTKVQTAETVNFNISIASSGPWDPNWGLPVIPLQGSLSGPAGERDFSNVTFKARVEHDLTAQNLVYAMASTGFLPGDVRLATQGPAITVHAYEQEKLTSYEVGSKNRFLGNRLQVNGAVFFYNYQGFQQQIDIAGNGSNFVTLTSPARMLGGEVEVSYRLTQADRLDLNLGRTDAYFYNTPTDGPYPLRQYVAERTIPGVVPLSAALSYNHSFHLPGGSTLDLYNQLRYQGSFYENVLTPQQAQLGVGQYIRSGTQWLDDLNVSWGSANGQYRATFYVHNLTDASYKQNATPIYVDPATATFNDYAASFTTNQPRFYGLILTAKF
jgi:outer membrane receptor protein involved in Fe transport